jgi:hypothetical protein
MFLDALKQPLPTTFRVAGSRQSVWTLIMDKLWND